MISINSAMKKDDESNITVTERGYNQPLLWLKPQFDKERELIEKRRKVQQQRIGMDSFPIHIYNAMLEDLCANNKWRDVMYLTCQANWGLRCGDMVNIRVQDLFTENCTFKDKFYLIEEKTKDTRKTKQTRMCVNNEAVRIAVTLFLMNNRDKRMYDYLFTSESNNKVYETVDGINIQKPLTHTALENVIKDTVRSFGIKLMNGAEKNDEGLKLNTHSLRKTFGEVFKSTSAEMLSNGMLEADEQAFQMAQLAFGHSSAKITQRYVGAVDEIIYNVVNQMNIGKDILEKYYRKVVEEV